MSQAFDAVAAYLINGTDEQDSDVEAAAVPLLMKAAADHQAQAQRRLERDTPLDNAAAQVHAQLAANYLQLWQAYRAYEYPNG